MKQLITCIFYLIFMGCKSQPTIPIGYRFELFESTPVKELAIAVRDENIEEIKSLVIQKKYNINYKEEKFGNTLIILAIANKKVASVNILLNLGADFNIKNKNGFNAIHELTNYYELTNESYLIAKSLISKGADVNEISTGSFKDSSQGFIYTPLKGAIRDTTLTKLLLENGANPYLRYNKDYIVWFNLCSGFWSENIFTARYMIVEKKLAIPNPIAFKLDGTPLDIFHFLEMKQFTGNLSNDKLKAREDILNYLKSINFPRNGTYIEN